MGLKAGKQRAEGNQFCTAKRRGIQLMKSEFQKERNTGNCSIWLSKTGERSRNKIRQDFLEAVAFN